MLRADVERGRIPDAVVVARKGRVAYVQAVGFPDKTARAPMTPDGVHQLHEFGSELELLFEGAAISG